jgi:pilus assembly protein CpaB
MVNLTKIAAGVLMVTALALGLFAWTLSRRPPPEAVHVASSVELSPTYPVVVTSKPLTAGQPITPDELRVLPMPVRPSGAFSDTALLAGRVPLADVGVDTPVVESQLSSGFAEQVQPGERAVAVHIDEGSAVGNRVRPGNFVDVFFTLKREGSAGGPGDHSEITQSQTRLLLSRIRVLAFGGTATGAGNPNQYGTLPHTAVLAVPTAEVDRLVLAETAGQLLLALRNPRDEEAVDMAALEPLPGVLKPATHTADADAPAASAAAGVSLSSLSESESGAHTATSSQRVAHREDTVELIEGGHAKTVAY